MWLQKLTLNNTRAPVNTNLVSAKHCIKNVCRRGPLIKAMGVIRQYAESGIGGFRQQLWRETEANHATAGLREGFLEKARKQALNSESICLGREQRWNF